MLSIIVAVHNQLGHNQLFLEGIRRYTTGPYEVIVIDNQNLHKYLNERLMLPLEQRFVVALLG